MTHPSHDPHRLQENDSKKVQSARQSRGDGDDAEMDIEEKKEFDSEGRRVQQIRIEEMLRAEEEGAREAAREEAELEAEAEAAAAAAAAAAVPPSQKGVRGLLSPRGVTAEMSGVTRSGKASAGGQFRANKEFWNASPWGCQQSAAQSWFGGKSNKQTPEEKRLTAQAEMASETEQISGSFVLDERATARLNDSV